MNGPQTSGSSRRSQHASNKFVHCDWFGYMIDMVDGPTYIKQLALACNRSPIDLAIHCLHNFNRAETNQFAEFGRLQQ